MEESWIKLEVIRKEKEIIQLKSDITRMQREGESKQLTSSRERLSKLESWLKQLQEALRVGLPQVAGQADLLFRQTFPRVHDKLKRQNKVFQNKLNNNINQYINEMSNLIRYCENEIRSNTKNIR